jgi:hypothetical protein
VASPGPVTKLGDIPDWFDEPIEQAVRRFDDEPRDRAGSRLPRRGEDERFLVRCARLGRRRPMAARHAVRPGRMAEWS